VDLGERRMRREKVVESYSGQIGQVGLFDPARFNDPVQVKVGKRGENDLGREFFERSADVGRVSGVMRTLLRILVVANARRVCHVVTVLSWRPAPGSYSCAGATSQ